ncbi:MAG: HEAT repeat domain-containing protein [Candidatus Odinarchaeia archaeon]
MGFYDLTKEERSALISEIQKKILQGIKNNRKENIKKFASDQDTYIRKNTYLIIGRLYAEKNELRNKILDILKDLLKSQNEMIRQTVIYAYGEIGKIDPEKVMVFLELGLSDEHYMVRNAVIGALKQIGNKKPNEVIKFAKKFLNHPNPKVRKAVIHGVELRGRTHPEDILPLLESAQNDPDKSVLNTIVHVLGQISYKEGCLEKVVFNLKKWENKKLVKLALKEIIDVHKRYNSFAAKTPTQAEKYIKENIGELKITKL